MSIIKNVLFAVLIAMILQGVLLFNAFAETELEPATTISTDSSISESTSESSALTQTTTATTLAQQTVSKKAISSTAVQNSSAKTNSNNENAHTKVTSTHAPHTYYMAGQTYSPSTSVDPNATTTTTVKKASRLGTSFYNFVWVYIPLIILCIAGLIYVNTKMAKKNKADDNDIYSVSKKSKQSNKKRIK